MLRKHEIISDHPSQNRSGHEAGTASATALHQYKNICTLFSIQCIAVSYLRSHPLHSVMKILQQGQRLCSS